MAWFGHSIGVHAKGETRPVRTFWWDREPATEAGVLRAVIFDADSTLTDDGRDVPSHGLIDSVMSLFCSGIWVGVVSMQRRACVETLVRHVVGDGLVETIVTIDDLDDTPNESELYRLALWEMGITPRDALAVTGSRRGRRAATAAAVPALAVRDGYENLLVADYQRMHRRFSGASR